MTKKKDRKIKIDIPEEDVKAYARALIEQNKAIFDRLAEL